MSKATVPAAIYIARDDCFEEMEEVGANDEHPDSVHTRHVRERVGEHARVLICYQSDAGVASDG